MYQQTKRPTKQHINLPNIQPLNQPLNRRIKQPTTQNNHPDNQPIKKGRRMTRNVLNSIQLIRNPVDRNPSNN